MLSLENQFNKCDCLKAISIMLNKHFQEMRPFFLSFCPRQCKSAHFLLVHWRNRDEEGITISLKDPDPEVAKHLLLQFPVYENPQPSLIPITIQLPSPAKMQQIECVAPQVYLPCSSHGQMAVIEIVARLASVGVAPEFCRRLAWMEELDALWRPRSICQGARRQRQVPSAYCASLSGGRLLHNPLQDQSFGKSLRVGVILTVTKKRTN